MSADAFEHFVSDLLADVRQSMLSAHERFATDREQALQMTIATLRAENAEMYRQAAQVASAAALSAQQQMPNVAFSSYSNCGENLLEPQVREAYPGGCFRPPSCAGDALRPPSCASEPLRPPSCLGEPLRPPSCADFFQQEVCKINAHVFDATRLDICGSEQSRENTASASFQGAQAEHISEGMDQLLRICTSPWLAAEIDANALHAEGSCSFIEAADAVASEVVLAACAVTPLAQSCSSAVASSSSPAVAGRAGEFNTADKTGIETVNAFLPAAVPRAAESLVDQAAASNAEQEENTMTCATEQAQSSSVANVNIEQEVLQARPADSVADDHSAHVDKFRSSPTSHSRIVEADSVAAEATSVENSLPVLAELRTSPLLVHADACQRSSPAATSSQTLQDNVPNSSTSCSRIVEADSVAADVTTVENSLPPIAEPRTSPFASHAARTDTENVTVEQVARSEVISAVACSDNVVPHCRTELPSPYSLARKERQAAHSSLPPMRPPADSRLAAEVVESFSGVKQPLGGHTAPDNQHHIQNCSPATPRVPERTPPQPRVPPVPTSKGASVVSELRKARLAIARTHSQGPTSRQAGQGSTRT